VKEKHQQTKRETMTTKEMNTLASKTRLPCLPLVLSQQRLQKVPAGSGDKYL
jgi:hypothetical protein